METSSLPHPVIDLSTPLYYQLLVYTLTDLPPLDGTPGALLTRDHAAIAPCRHRPMPPSPRAAIAPCRHRPMPRAAIAPCCHRPMLPHAAIAPCCHRPMLPSPHAAIAKVVALLPVNANEADLAPSFACSVAQCIAPRAQAPDSGRGDVAAASSTRKRHWVGTAAERPIRIEGTDRGYGSMVRMSLSMHGRLMRVQALRRKREAVDTEATEAAWAPHVAERSMLAVVDPDAGPLEAAWTKVAAAAIRVDASAAGVERKDCGRRLGNRDKFSGCGF